MKPTEQPDFSGYVTRNNLECADGRVIMRDAFKECDGITVPLCWNHDHDNPNSVLGHMLLENRNDGVYGYGYFNESDDGKQGKELVQHGDVRSLSIYANKLKQAGNNVMHGRIREVSLVLAGANPGAFIDTVIAHSDTTDEEMVIGYDQPLMLYHSEESTEEPATKTTETEEKKEMAEDKTVQDVFDSMTEEQKTVVYALIGAALENEGGASEKKEEDSDMKQNIFDSDSQTGDTLTHSEEAAIIGDAKRYGSMKESFLAHSEEYGIENIDYLFPEAKNITTKPEFIQRDMGWVSKVMGGVSHNPFAKIKSTFADITEDEARAKGYIKGKYKKEEFFSLMKRTTSPTTIYKKQKMDRDNIIDITDMDVVAWIKTEMRLMLDEEIARAILVGDGRLASDDDHIKTDCIRPVAFDEDLFNIKVHLDLAEGHTEDDLAKAFIRKIIKARKDYKGSGNPTLYTTEDMLSNLLLLTDDMGRDLYPDEAAVCKKLRVKEIVTVPVMENLTNDEGKTIYGVLVNLSDYKVGADKGGSINMFEDFDIDYNQEKYLIETRCSGCLIKPYSAMTIMD